MTVVTRLMAQSRWVALLLVLMLLLVDGGMPADNLRIHTSTPGYVGTEVQDVIREAARGA